VDQYYKQFDERICEYYLSPVGMETRKTVVTQDGRYMQTHNPYLLHDPTRNIFLRAASSLDSTIDTAASLPQRIRRFQVKRYTCQAEITMLKEIFYLTWKVEGITTPKFRAEYGGPICQDSFWAKIR
jgi:hypothetical protein